MKGTLDTRLQFHLPFLVSLPALILLESILVCGREPGVLTLANPATVVAAISGVRLHVDRVLILK